MFNLSLFSESQRNFFRTLVSQTMKDRELKKIFRPDMIYLLMEAKKGDISVFFIHQYNVMEMPCVRIPMKVIWKTNFCFSNTYSIPSWLAT